MEVTLDADSIENRQCNENCTGQKRTTVRHHHTKESKMRNRLSKLHYLMFFLSMAAMTGCGANNAGTSAALNSSAAGGVAAKLQWQSGAAGSAKSQARALASTIPAGVANIQFTVTGTGANGAIPVVKSTVPATGTGQINGVYPGTVAVAVKAVDSTGNTLYEGFAVNVDVNAGATTDVGTITMAQPIVKAAEVPCLGCHETALDATGQNIVANYKQSGHYINTTFKDANGVGAGCAGCHGPSHNTPDPSAGGSAARCFECHNLNNAAAGIVTEHFTGSNTQGYYTANNTPCAACHQFHNSAAANMERKTYAQSRHGAADYSTSITHNSGGCSRCHNGKAFMDALGNPTVNNTLTYTSQQITCDSCHTNAPLGKLRALAGTTGNPFATYTTSTKGYQFYPNTALNPNKKAYYPDVAGSNLCVVCHSGSGGTASVSMNGKSAWDPYFANYSTAKTFTAHNLPAAAVMYVKSGFTNLSTGTAGVPTQAYLNSLTSDLDAATGATGIVSSTHRKFGTSAIATDSHVSASKPAPANLKVNGPCATCHLAGSHSLKIDSAAYEAVCINCHTSEGSLSGSVNLAYKDNSGNYPNFINSFIEPNKTAYQNAFVLAATILNQRAAAKGLSNVNFYINPNNLKFSIGNNTLNTTKNDGSYNSYSGDLRGLAVSLGYTTAISHNNVLSADGLAQQKFFGAVSNLMLLSADQGGFAHARTYVRRLIYDSIDFLDDGALNASVVQTAIATSLVGSSTTNPVFGLYKKGTTAYTDGTLSTIASGTTEGMLFLAGWDRGTGKWNTGLTPAKYERP
jgi:hypothetical protein